MTTITCSQRCRQARWRFGRLCRARIQATQPLRLAYADPPYPGTAARYYRHHPAFAGEISITSLLETLSRYDGWALSTSASALQEVLHRAWLRGLPVRVASWHRGARVTASRWPLNGWEPVVYAGGRRLVSRAATHDTLVYHPHARLTDPRRVIGTKPAAFAYWLFDLLGARPGHQLADLYPGSGGITRAWRELARRSAAQPSPRSRHDASRRPIVDSRHSSRRVAIAATLRRSHA